MATILIVDDESSVRLFLVQLLAARGYRLLEASDGAEALAMVEAHHPDLVITDITMPTMDGYEFVRQLRSDPGIAATPVIFHTAFYHQREAFALAQACGVNHLLCKPTEVQTILNTVQAALAGSPPSAPPAPSEEFDRDHLRLLTDRLAHEVDELEKVNSRLTAILEVSRHLAQERDPGRLLQEFCRAARYILGARYGAVGIVDASGERLAPFLTSGLDPKTVTRIGAPSPRMPPLSRLLDGGGALRIGQLAGEIEAEWFAQLPPPAKSFLGVALASTSRLYGVLFLVEKLGADNFSPQDEQIAVALAAQLAVAYENALRYDEIQMHAARAREYSQRLQSLSRQLLSAQETERRHIARELHDQIGQALTAVKINLQALQRAPGTLLLGPRLDDSIETVDGTLDQVRNLSLDLRPSMLDDLGLGPALRWYLDRQARRGGFGAQLAVDLFPEPLATELETTCFRVVQEGLTNVVRHARARHVRVEVQQQGSELHLVVRDDGVGFDVAAARSRAAQGASLGLLGMHERVALLGGQIDIVSQPGQGTEIRIRLPVIVPATSEDQEMRKGETSHATDSRDPG
jgi:signal transduction histidine kinase/CheY-like chemotaxis protein